MVSKDSFLKSLAPNLSQILLLVLSVVAAFYIGRLSAEVKMYREGLQLNNPNAAGQPTQPGQQPQAEPYQPIDPGVFVFPSEQDHIRGDGSANIAIVEYSDFDCPFCQQFHETAQQVLDEYPGEVFWVYRHYPLEQLHPDAMNKSVASECVYQQGGDEAFWGFADRVFESGSGVPLNETSLQEHASALGLNAAQLLSCYNNRETENVVTEDLQEGTTAGVRGTPGNYIVNMETETAIPLQGAEPFSNVVNVIEMVQ